MRLVAFLCFVSVIALSKCSTPSAQQPSNAGSEKQNANQARRVQDAEKLVRSIQQNDAENVQRLLSAGADPNEKGLDYLPLMMAVLKRSKQIVEVLLTAGANVNATSEIGDTSLTMAVASGDTEIVDLLIERGADLTVRDKYGSTVLHKAARESDGEMMKRLLATGVDPNLKDSEDNTPLIIAPGNLDVVTGKSIDIVRLLIEKGADVNAKNKYGGTPLHAAIGSEQTVKLLLEHGADVNAKNNDAWTPLEVALLRGCPSTVQLLEKAGAKE